MDEYSFGMETSVDVEELDNFIHNILPGLLLNNTTNFGIAGFCLQAVCDAFEAAVAELEDEIDN